MTARAPIRQSTLDRAVKVAKQHGWAVQVRGDVITLLPIEGGLPLPSADPADSEAAWDKALGLQS